MVFKRSWLRVALFALLAIAVPTTSAIAGPSVLIANKKKSASKFRPAFSAAVKAEGIEVKEIDLKPKAKALDAGKKAGVGFVISIAEKSKKDKGSATLTLFSVATGAKLQTQKVSWKSAKEATKEAAAQGERFAAAILAAEATAGEPQEAPEMVPLVEPVTKATIPVEPPKVPPPEPPAPEPEVAPDPALEETTTTKSDTGKRHAKIGLELGSQLITSYSLKVGGTPTLLSYSLSPLLAIGARAAFDVSVLRLGAALSIVPVKYVLDIDPPVTPPEPSGLFLAVEARVGYPIVLSDAPKSRLELVPTLGFSMDKLGVEEQSQSVVLSSTAIAPVIGVELALLGEDIDLGVDAHARLVVAYSEAPTTSGTGGGGFGFGARAHATFWISDSFGAVLSALFELDSMSFSGTGDRLRLRGDPELLDASVSDTSLGANLGLVLAL